MPPYSFYFMLIIILLPINATVNDNTDQFKTDVTYGGLVQRPLHSPTATLGMSFDAAKLQKQLYLCKFNLKKLLFARLAFENPLLISNFWCIFAETNFENIFRNHFR